MVLGIGGSLIGVSGSYGSCSGSSGDNWGAGWSGEGGNVGIGSGAIVR